MGVIINNNKQFHIKIDIIFANKLETDVRNNNINSRRIRYNLNRICNNNSRI